MKSGEGTALSFLAVSSPLLKSVENGIGGVRAWRVAGVCLFLLQPVAVYRNAPVFNKAYQVLIGSVKGTP